MARDDTKLGYYSGWDIDQLIATNTVAISVATTTLYTGINSTNPNVFEVQFKPTGLNYWFTSGTSSKDGTLANLFTFTAYVQNNNLILSLLSGVTTGTARYFVWADKVNY